MNQTGVLIVAIFALLSVTLINIAGVKMGELFSSIFTSFKLVGIASLIICGIFLGQYFGQNFSSTALPRQPSNLSLWGAMAIAMIGVLWSYGGWHHASYLSAETKNPNRTVPIAMILGAIIVTLTYVLTNVAYLYLMPIQEMASSKAIAADALQKVVPIGAILIAILIAISTIGTVGIYTLSAPRIYFSMGKDGTFFPWLAKVSTKTGVSVNAILLQSGWALILLLFWGTFENLITYVVFMDWIFMIFAAITVFKFRRRKIQKEGEYKTFLYPFTPLIFIGISVWFVIQTSIGRPSQALAGLILLGLGVPVY